MTENLSDAELDALEKRHPQMQWYDGRFICDACAKPWPCPTLSALAELREWRATHTRGATKCYVDLASVEQQLGAETFRSMNR